MSSRANICASSVSDSPSYWDGPKRLAGGLFAVTAIPLTVIISPEGAVALSYEGAREWDEPGLVEAIRALAGAEETFAVRVARLEAALR